MDRLANQSSVGERRTWQTRLHIGGKREFRCLALNVHRVWNVEQAIVSTLAKAKGLKVANNSTMATVLSWLLQVLAQDSEFGSQRLWGDGSPIQVGYEVTGRIADSSLTVAPRGFTAARLPSPSLWVWVSQMLGLTPVAPSRCIAAGQSVVDPCPAWQTRYFSASLCELQSIIGF